LDDFIHFLTVCQTRSNGRQMTTSIAELIADRMDQMPAGERRAAQILIANYPLTGLRTVAEFSAQAGVSSPTILRFVARLGFQNYADFQARLQDELAAQLQSPLSRATGPDSDRHTTPFVAAAIENMRETFRHLSERQVDDIVGVLSNRRGKVYLVGGRFTDPVAAYMAAHLAIVRPGVQHLNGQESNWRDRLIDMGRNDVVVIFDIRRYQESLLRLAEAAHGRGAQIILLTDQWLSPIARYARHVVAGRTAVPSAWDSSVALFLVAEALIGDLTRKLEDVSAKRIREMENLRGG
jgi:DNA-binding MurR/RpiR family transcriptional regulator